jgi:hypothetical protein
MKIILFAVGMSIVLGFIFLGLATRIVLKKEHKFPGFRIQKKRK